MLHRMYLRRDVVGGTAERSSCHWWKYILLAHPKVSNLAVPLTV